jgi:hypothetical protein
MFFLANRDQKMLLRYLPFKPIDCGLLARFTQVLQGCNEDMINHQSTSSSGGNENMSMKYNRSFG